LSHNPHFCKSALKRYSQWDFIALVEKHGIAYHEKKDGQLFCDHSASDIVGMLLDECAAQDVEIKLNTAILAVEKQGAGYLVTTAEQVYACQSVVVALGGPSIPTLGATGLGYELAKQFQIPVFEPRAALVPFIITDQFKALCVAL